VLSPNTLDTIRGRSDDYEIIGNIAEYGKYSRGTIRGAILDGKTGEPLIGAGVFVAKTNARAVTDQKGHFNITLPVGDYDVKLSYVGYEDNITKIKLCGNGSATFEVMEKSIKLNEVIIVADRNSNLLNTQMSLIQLDRRSIRELPVTLGETDIIKSISLLPGIQSTGEFGTGFNVRGGNADQNLILIQNVPVFNPSHVFGLESVINPDGVMGVSLMKAGIPAKYGERASSIMDIQMGTNNTDQVMIKGGLGLINSRLSIDIPFLKNKVNLLVGCRCSYSDWLLHRMPDVNLKNSSANFYDFNFLMNIIVNANNKLSIFGYNSNDKFGLNKTTTYDYGNTLGSLAWNHNFGDKLTSNLVLGISKYNFYTSEFNSFQSSTAYKIKSSTLYNSLKWNLHWSPFEKHVVDFGINGICYSIKPGDLSPYNGESQVESINVQQQKAYESAAYFGDNIRITPKLTTELGIRYTFYAQVGPGNRFVYDNNYPKSPATVTDTLFYKNNEVMKRYSGLEPRISLRYSLNDSSSLKLSYTRHQQFINLISNTSVMVPSDVWQISNSFIKPLVCSQFALGYYHNFNRNSIETSVEIYYKKLNNIVEYKNGAKVLLNNHLETDLTNAEGYSYGMELYVKKNSGKLTGWLSYTYSRSKRRTTSIEASEQINRNQYFSSDFDKPHNLVMVTNYHLSRRWRCGGTFTYITGRPVTLPESQYWYKGFELINYSDRNKYRLPAYHRLDVYVTLEESLWKKKKWKTSWTLSIINLYGRKNAYSVFYQQSKPASSFNAQFQQYGFYELYIIGNPLPTLTFNFTF
jgi:hypothetical protein